MARIREWGPSVWVTYIAGLLSGERHCEWNAWFRSVHYPDSWKRMDTTDWSEFRIAHRARVKELAAELRAEGYNVFLEPFVEASGKTHRISLTGKPDIVGVKDGEGLVVDVKTGQSKEADIAQVNLYLFAIPRSDVHVDFGRVPLRGRVVYYDHMGKVDEVDIPEIGEVFTREVIDLLIKLSGDEPSPTPSRHECRFCPITNEDCPARLDGDASPTIEPEF